MRTVSKTMLQISGVCDIVARKYNVPTYDASLTYDNVSDHQDVLTVTRIRTCKDVPTRGGVLTNDDILQNRKE